MAVGFSTDVFFDVVPDDEARLPLPVPSDSDDSETYEATILLANMAEFNQLRAYKSLYTLLPAMGGGGIVVVTSGLGRRTLTIPLSDGTEAAYHAILTAISGRPRMTDDSYLTADVSFLILGSAD